MSDSSEKHLLCEAAAAMAQLHAGKDLRSNIDTALGILGKAVAVDRVYVFQNHYRDESSIPLMSQRHEWTSINVSSEVDNPELQNLPYETFSTRWYNMLSAGREIAGLVRDFPDGERPLLEKQSIRSILVLPIQIDGRFWGFIGFDDCHTDRVWSTTDKRILEATAGRDWRHLHSHGG